MNYFHLSAANILAIMRDKIGSLDLLILIKVCRPAGALRMPPADPCSQDD